MRVTLGDQLDRRRALRQPQLGLLAAVLVAAGAYLIEPPQVPDLAAQVARMHVAQAGSFLFWTGWFGGLNLPSYSPIGPIVMSWVGVSLTAVLSSLATILAGYWLFRGTRRPGLGLATFTVAVLVDMFCGRVTFALGLACAVLSLSLLRGRRSGWAAAAGLLACLASPLAGLFLGLVAVAVAVADRSRQLPAGVLAAALLALGVLLGVVSPGTGRMPYPWWHMLIGEVIVAALALMCPQRGVRAACAVVGLATLAFFVVPLAVGTNIIRIEWLAAAPVAVACADLRRLPFVRHVPLVAFAVALFAWPMADLGVQLAVAGEPTASQAFYQPLIGELQAQVLAAGPAAAGERVEVVDSASQWSAAYVAPQFPLARGWDRQVDRADNPLFYNGSLTPAHYHRWLSHLAVGWVALPRQGSFDYAATDEAALVGRQPAFLRLVWQNPNWQLYRVADARPLVTGATVTAVGGDGVTLRADHAGPVRLQLRWSPYLTLTQGSGIVRTCIKARGSWTTIWLPAPGTYTVGARFAISRPGSEPGCPASQH